MPTYEYRCPSGHDFERFYRKISDASPQVACPDCGKIAERIMSAGGGLLFKGSGFYLTDYGKNAHRGGAPEKATSEPGGDSAAPAAAATADGASSSKETASSKESSSSKESGAKESSSKPAESKSAPAPKAESKSSSESKPVKSSGSKVSKDK